MKRILSVVALASMLALPAAADMKTLVLEKVQQTAKVMTAARLNWKVGDTLNFSLGAQGGLPIQGTVVMEVTNETTEGIVLLQTIDLGMFGKQTAESTINPDTGEIVRYKVNGREQKPPESGGGKMQIKKQEETNITVPAGTFDCIYILVEDDQGSESEMWVNPMEIPLMGMLKMVQKAQGLTLELTSFQRGN